MKFTSNIAVLGALSVLACGSVYAAGNAYDVGRSVDALVVSTDGAEFGDQISLFGLLGTRKLTGFSVEYYSNYNLPGGLTIRFYDNDGPAGIPKTLEYQSAPVDIKLGGGIVNITFNQPKIATTFTYTVAFLGSTGANVAGLLAPNQDPSVGSSFNDYWTKESGTWQLNNLGPIKANFTASVNAVPEPGTYVLAGVAGFGWLAFAGYRRFRK